MSRTFREVPAQLQLEPPHPPPPHQTIKQYNTNINYHLEFRFGQSCQSLGITGDRQEIKSLVGPSEQITQQQT